MRQWIHNQELHGNTIKFSTFDSKYCVGFQRSKFRGREPHFFIYEILKRKVVRRFLPMLDPPKAEWADTADASGRVKIVATEAWENNPEDSDLDRSRSEDQGVEDFTEDVTVFEVSPQGSFLLAFVSNEFLVLKMLPKSVTPAFRNILTPSFMISEHIAYDLDRE